MLPCSREGGGSTTTLPTANYPALFTGSDADVTERLQKAKDDIQRLGGSIDTRNSMIQRLKAELDQCRRTANNGKVSDLGTSLLVMMHFTR